MTGIYLAKNQLRNQHVDQSLTEGLGQGERYGGEQPQEHLIWDWTHVSTSGLLYGWGYGYSDHRSKLECVEESS
jgi:hypothetical protein